MKPLTLETAWPWAASRCALREICRADIFRKLQEKGLSASDADTICDRLERERYLDDTRFARAFAHDKFCYDGWGRIKIAQALRLKGIESDIVHAGIAEAIEETAYATKLHDILAQKNRSIKEPDNYKRMQKLVRFAASRGFEADIIFRTLECMD